MGKEDRHQRPAHKITGLTGELLTALELLRYGFTVSWPMLDVDGYDLLSDDGRGSIKRLQVKSCHSTTKSGTYRMGFYKGSKTKTKYTKADCDFIVAVLFYPDGTSFYVLPIEEVTGFHASFWPKGKHPSFPRRRQCCKYEHYLCEWGQLN